MRWPRVRFTIRRMMVAVAALAVVISGCLEAIRLKRRRDLFLTAASLHAQSELYTLNLERSYRVMAEQRKNQASVCLDQAAKLAKTAGYHATLKRKYQRAASHPWVAIVPDP